LNAASALIVIRESAEMSLPSDKNLSALLDERRTFPPSKEFQQRATWNDPGIYDRAAKDPEGFWVAEAKHLDWFAPWEKVLEWNVPWAKWFMGAKLNVTYNCVDRHAHSARRNKAAIVWEGEPGDSRVLTVWHARARSESLRQRSEIAGRSERRPCRDLHGHGAGTGNCHARMREDRSRAFSGVRRIFGGGACANASTTPRRRW